MFSRTHVEDIWIFFPCELDKIHVWRDTLKGTDAKFLHFSKISWSEKAIHCKESLYFQKVGGKLSIVFLSLAQEFFKMQKQKGSDIITIVAVNACNFVVFSHISVLSMLNSIFKQLYCVKQTTTCPDSWLRRSSWLIPCQQSWPYAENRIVEGLFNNISSIQLFVFSCL